MAKPVVVAAVGLPGSGKSTVFRALASVIEGAHWLNQDEFYGDARAFTEAVAHSTAPVVLADKCHHTSDIRKFTKTAADGRELVWVWFHHPDDKIFETTKQTLVCFDRMKKRKGHPSLNATNYAQAYKKLQAKWAPPMPSDGGRVFRVDMTRPPAVIVSAILKELGYTGVAISGVNQAVADSIEYEKRFLVRPPPAAASAPSRFRASEASATGDEHVDPYENAYLRSDPYHPFEGSKYDTMYY